ncbi:Acetyltransferase (GNAT) family protein [Actinacidiphila alni]|uniref:Acetyltransferase (GNAT) family protein n=1 Tax=Actinacidiphila alni TaxID=380248 RepID=A0A1I2KQX0_9ACTN|nr:GNAT family N-acetyltransferase [Actinacidiphila alni]SFF68758.1 Acetyltransferase (GNAT) family protein [Actinacidiphila alni]
MRSPDGWHLTDDVDVFLGRAGDFLRSRAALHTMQVTAAEGIRTGIRTGRGRVRAGFGWLAEGGEVGGAFVRVGEGLLGLTPVSPGQAEALAVRLAGAGHRVPGVSAGEGAAAAFATAWERRTGATAEYRGRLRLYRLAGLVEPRPAPPGRARHADGADRDRLVAWCADFAAAVGDPTVVTAATWAGTRFAAKRFTFWQAPDGSPVALAGATAPVAAHVRIDPVYTPPHLRGHGYAAAVTAAVARTALAAGVTDVALFADPANATSNALYRRLGFVPLTDVAHYAFTP